MHLSLFRDIPPFDYATRIGLRYPIIPIIVIASGLLLVMRFCDTAISHAGSGFFHCGILYPSLWRGSYANAAYSSAQFLTV